MLNSIQSRSDKLTEKFVSIQESIHDGQENQILAILLGKDKCDLVRKTGWNVLVVNPGSTSTKVSVFSGLRQMAMANIPLLDRQQDGLMQRIQTIRTWLEAHGFDLGELQGIAARGGFLEPVAPGTYRISQEMVADLKKAPFAHASNLAVPIALEIARTIDHEMLLTVTDPVTVDEIDFVYRMTGTSKMVDDGTAVHVLNHRAVLHMLAFLEDRSLESLHVITCHMGGGMSAARHLNGRLAQVSQAFGQMPSANRSGALPLHKLLQSLNEGRLSLEEIRQEVFFSGGLLSLAGTSDFQALLERKNKAEKSVADRIEQIIEFYTNRIAATLLALSAVEQKLDAMVLTGGLAYATEFTERIQKKIQLPVPILRIPGSLEQEALAAGLLTVFMEPQSLKEYPKARQYYLQARTAEQTLFQQQIFPHSAPRASFTFPRTLQDILGLAHPEGRPPMTVVLVGADNVEALLAIKSANEVMPTPLARFLLVGPFARVSQMCWELDVLVDQDWYTLVDASNMIECAAHLYQQGLAQILMKGSVMTGDLLKVYLKTIKATQASPKRRLSHLSLFQIPGRGKLLGITDAAINTYPDVNAWIDILQNAQEALSSLGFHKLKVAVISAVEKPSQAIESSKDAQQLVEQIGHREDMIVEGPLSVDIALSPQVAEEKGYQGKIRGDADLLLLPDIDAGNALYKSFTVVGGATLAGTVLGGKTPLILTSRGDSAKSKLASISLALALAQNQNYGACP